MTSAPRFTVLVPTRERHDTLRSTMETVLGQPGSDYELLVMDNRSSPQTAAVVRSFPQDRVRYLRSEARLSMADNWELGLSHARGEYVTVLGDDDALMLDCLTTVRQLLRQAEANQEILELIAWRRAMYHWPSAHAPWLRNKLLLRVDDPTLPWWRDSRALLSDVMQWRADIEWLPMIYNGFVHRDVIARVKAKLGRYFETQSPDIASGIANAYVTSSFLYLHRPLTVAGNSGHSTGAASAYGGAAAAGVLGEFAREAKLDAGAITHPRLIPSKNMEIAIAACMLEMRDKLFPNEAEDLDLDVEALIDVAAVRLLRDPSRYQDGRRDLEALAAKFQLPLSRVWFPNKPDAQPDLVRGFVEVGALGQKQLVVDGDLAGIATVADAARLASGILGPVQPLPSRQANALGVKGRASALATDLADSSLRQLGLRTGRWLQRKLPRPLRSAMTRAALTVLNRDDAQERE